MRDKYNKYYGEFPAMKKAADAAMCSAAPGSIEEAAACVFAPVIFSYILWVLRTAEEKKIKRLYFLARDGFLFHSYAQQICAKYGISIECRYLYASRLAWRMPFYHLHTEEARSLIFHGGYVVTPHIVLERVMLTQEERAMVYRDAGLWPIAEDEPMSIASYHKFSEAVANSGEFWRLVCERSKEAYRPAIEYLRQEGLLEPVPFALVDTGWTGSMQRTLRQLLESQGFRGEISGFYFGMFEQPKDPRDGNYFPWYFSCRSSSARVAKFNNNVLECMCVSPDAMTQGYRAEGSAYVPVFLNKPPDLPKELFERQWQVYQSFLSFLLKAPPDARQEERLRKLAVRLLESFMYRPDRDEAEALMHFVFCDDVAEGYKNPVVRRVSHEELQGYSFLRRLYRKLVGGKKIADLFWPYGSLAASDIRHAGWYRLNILWWEMVRHRFF